MLLSAFCIFFLPFFWFFLVSSGASVGLTALAGAVMSSVPTARARTVARSVLRRSRNVRTNVLCALVSPTYERT